MSAPDWERFAREVEEETGHVFHPESLSDPAFCFAKLAEMGYSLSVTFATRESIDAARKRNGVPPLTGKEAEIVARGMFSYQLFGGPVEKRGDHGCPMVPTLAQAAATALYNVCRLYENRRDRPRGR